MDGRGKSCTTPAWFSTVVLMALVVHLATAQDTTPPTVTCDNVTTLPSLPNSFLGLDLDVTYTYSDDNPDPSGITYNVSEGPFGDLFPPGRTPITMFAFDTLRNMATCLFYVENPLTELPVDCLNVNQTIGTDMGQPTYNYSLSFGVSDVTKSIPGYRYHGDVSVDPTITVGSKLEVGTHPETVVISDEVLSKACAGYVVVEDMEEPNVTCPADITESSTNVIRFSANVTDNVGASLTYSSEPGSRFSPGSTMVSVTALDQAGLNDTCSFMVHVSLTELPVECSPDETVQISSDSTYEYPPVTKDNLTLTDSTYQFYGDVTIDMLVNGTENYTLSIGTYFLTFQIDDTILNKTCSSVLIVKEKQTSGRSERFSTTVIVVVTCVVLLVIIAIACCICYCMKRSKRRKEKANPSGGKEKYTKSSVV